MRIGRSPLRRLLAPLALAVAGPALAAQPDCSSFGNEAASARFLARLRQSGVKFSIDPKQGVGFEISDADRARFTRLYDEASRRVTKDVIAQGNVQGVPSAAAQARLRQSAGQLREALAIFPASWNAMWTLGKIHQRLGEHAEAFQWFMRAFDINPTQPDVAREAGLEALDIARFDDGTCLFQAAIRGSPQDGGLHANLALAHLFAGRLADARKEAEAAVKQDPKDEVSAKVLRLVRDVQSGARPAPKRAADLR